MLFSAHFEEYVRGDPTVLLPMIKPGILQKELLGKSANNAVFLNYMPIIHVKI
jgi:hypothetical protein